MKNVKKRFVSIAITLAILGILIASGPASAITLSIERTDGSSSPNEGEEITFSAKIDLHEQDYFPISSIDILIDTTPEDDITNAVVCSFDLEGNALEGNDEDLCDINITDIQVDTTEGGYGYGYGYGEGYAWNLSDESANPELGNWTTDDNGTMYNYSIGYGYDIFNENLKDTAEITVDFKWTSPSVTSDTDYNIAIGIHSGTEDAVEFTSQEVVSVTVQNIHGDPVTTSNIAEYAGWQTEDFNITLTAEDNLSSIAYTNYSIDGEMFTGTLIQINTNGNHTITFFSENNDEVVETAHTIYALLDKAAPTTESDIGDYEGWQTEDFTIVLTSEDSDSGVAYTNYTIEGGVYTGTLIEITEDGNYTITFYSVDNAGNVEEPTTINALLDKSAPVTESDIGDYEGWQAEDFNITLTSDDTYSGVAFTNYTLDGVMNTGTLIEITEDGNHTITFFSVDNEGNAEEAQTITALLDKAAPTTESDIGDYEGWQTENFNITLTSEDTDSGVAYTNYTLDGEMNTGNIIEITEDGNYTITFFSVDNVGNEEDVTTITALLDKAAPTTESDIGDYEGWQDDDFTITLTPEDNLSGVSYTNYTIDGEMHTGTAIDINEDGNFTITFFSADNAGNEENATTITALLNTSTTTHHHHSSTDVVIDNTATNKKIDHPVIINSADSPNVEQITFNLQDNVQNVKVEVKEVPFASIAISGGDKVFKYLKIDLDPAALNIMNYAKIKFKVSKQWLIDNGLTRADVVLKRLVSNVWVELETTYLGETATDYEFEATTPGFSYFAIGVKAKTVITETKTPDVIIIKNPEPEVIIQEPCIKKITYAIDPAAGKCVEFATTCDVPKEWEIVEKCNAEFVGSKIVEPRQKTGLAGREISIILLVLIVVVLVSWLVYRGKNPGNPIRRRKKYHYYRP